VIADEAHRSQYDFIDGFARHMRDALPRASFIGFTGTPIELADANTRAVFGDYISIYYIFENMPQKNLAVDLLANSSRTRSGGAARTWCRRGRLPRCWNRPSGATRTAPSRPRR